MSKGNNFIHGERYRIIDNKDWENKILFYVGQSVKSKTSHYFEASLDYFHLNKSFDTFRILVDEYKFINVSMEEAERLKKEKKIKLEQEIAQKQKALEELDV